MKYQKGRGWVIQFLLPVGGFMFTNLFYYSKTKTKKLQMQKKKEKTNMHPYSRTKL